jgi:hypothetical protein
MILSKVLNLLPFRDVLSSIAFQVIAKDFEGLETRRALTIGEL